MEVVGCYGCHGREPRLLSAAPQKRYDWPTELKANGTNHPLIARVASQNVAGVLLLSRVSYFCYYCYDYCDNLLGLLLHSVTCTVGVLWCRSFLSGSLLTWRSCRRPYASLTKTSRGLTETWPTTCECPWPHLLTALSQSALQEKGKTKPE